MLLWIYLHDPAPAIQRSLVTPWLDLPMAALSIACEGWALALLVLLLALSVRRSLLQGLVLAAPSLTAMATTGLLVQLVKHVVTAPRPLALLGPRGVHVVLEPLQAMSFPSGHAATAAALATWATVRYGWRAWWLCALAFLGGLSRIYVGAHWATDVGAGWLLGMAVGAGAAALWRSAPATVPSASRI
jgi:undecaprenyl-diphosphatase